MHMALDAELRAVGNTLADLVDLQPQAADRAPLRPRRGMQRLAVDPWDPLGTTGQPYWVWYDGTAWVAMDTDTDTWRPLPAPKRRAMVHRTTNYNVADATYTPIPWTAEIYDEGGWHDNSTNNTRLVVPEGVGKVRVSGNLTFNSSGTVGTLMRMQATKNGATSYGLPRAETIYPARIINGASAILEVSPGDYFELEAYHTEGTSHAVLATEYTWFAIEEVD